MSEQLRSLRYERDIRDHGAAVTTRPWWDAPGEDSRAMRPMSAEDPPGVIEFVDNKELNGWHHYILANVRPGT